MDRKIVVDEPYQPRMDEYWRKYLDSLTPSKPFTRKQEAAFRNTFYGGAIAAFDIMDKAMFGTLDDTMRIRDELRAEFIHYVGEEEKRYEEQRKGEGGNGND